MLKKAKKSFGGIFLVLLSGLAVTAWGSDLAGSRPNIVLVLVDDLGFSDLGCYGGDIDTPVIDGLAEAGLRFTRITNAAKCTTSRYSLLAGQYHRAGYHKMKRSTTLAEPLQKAGYATWGIGKWDTHNTTPLDYGFEKFFGFVNGSSDYVAGNGKWLLNENRFTEFGQDASEFYATRNLTNYLIQFLKEQEEAKDKRPKEELYRLENDADSIVNLANHPAFKTEKEKLAKKLMAVREATKDPRLTDAFDHMPWTNPGVKLEER